MSKKISRTSQNSPLLRKLSTFEQQTHRSSYLKRSNTQAHPSYMKDFQKSQTTRQRNQLNIRVSEKLISQKSIKNLRIPSGFSEVVRFKSDSLDKLIHRNNKFQKSIIQKKNSSKETEKSILEKQRSNSIDKLHKQVSDHRRVRSSSKISAQLIQQKQFFKQEKIQNKITRETLNSEESQIRQPQESLENLLQLKLKTQASTLQSTQLTSVHNTTGSRLSKYTGFTFGSKYHHKSKMSDLLSEQQLNNSKQLIKETQKLRKSQKLRANPKQWQFHNCLALQKIQLYSTNLKISCEGWTVLDHLELKFLRGFNPKIQDDFSPLIRLLIFKISEDLPKLANYSFDISTIMIRVNDKHIYEDDRQKQKQKGQKLRGIAPHSIISLRDLITTILITKHIDLIVHAVLALGYLLKLINENTKLDANPFAEIDNGDEYFIFIKNTDRGFLSEICNYFVRQCQCLFRELDLSTTKINVSFSCLYKDFNKASRDNRSNHKQFTVTSTSLEMSVLFMKCLTSKYFKDALSMRAFETSVRFQVGWNFWQKRTQKWSNQQYVKYGIKGVGGRNNKSNECFTVWDDRNDLIISMADCKINMHWKDNERIIQWVVNHIPRFLKQYSKKMKFYPTGTQRIKKID